MSAPPRASKRKAVVLVDVPEDPKQRNIKAFMKERQGKENDRESSVAEIASDVENSSDEGMAKLTQLKELQDRGVDFATAIKSSEGKSGGKHMTVPASWQAPASQASSADSSVSLTTEEIEGALFGGGQEHKAAPTTPWKSLSAFPLDVEAPPNDLIEQYLKRMQAIPVAAGDTAEFEARCKEVAAAAPKRAPAAKSASTAAKEHAAATGEFPIRGEIGSKFYRQHKPGSEAQLSYQALAHQEKIEYRKKWAKTVYEKVTERQGYQESFDDVSEQWGTYCTFGTLVQSYGGWEWGPAVHGAKLTAAMCSKMAGKWVWVDPFSQLPHFLKMEVKHKEIFQKKWSCFVAMTNKETMRDEAHTEETGSTCEGEASHAPRGSTEKPPVEEARGKSAREKAKAKSAAKRSTEECADKEEQHNVKTKLKAATKDAIRIKTLLKAERAKASDLANRIQSGTPAYAWADNPPNVGKLLALKQSVDDRLDDFGNEFLVQELRTLTHKYTDQRLLELMLQFAKIEDDVKALAKKTATIVAMHLKATA